MTRSFSHPYVLLVLTAAFWGANAVAGKLAVGHISPMMLTFLRWGIAILVLLPFVWPRLKTDWPVIRANLVLLALLGAFGMTAFNALLYTALFHTSAVQATIVQAGMPVIVFLGMFLFFRIRVAWIQVIGFSFTAVGVVLTATRGDPSALLALELNRGDAMIVVAVILYGSYTVALTLKPKLHWLSLIFSLAVAAWLASMPLLAAEIAGGTFVAPDARGWAIAVFAAILPSLVSQVFYIRGVELIGPNRANLFVNLMPIFGAIMAVAILGERLHPYHFAALVLVLGGITLAERARGATPGVPPTR